MNSSRSPAPTSSRVCVDDIRNWFDRHRDRILADWFAFLRYPSISADSEQATACRHCAAWLRDYLSHLGMHSELLSTDGHPAVFADHSGAGAMRVLFYGHYDVQPVDPLDAWESPPFQPTRRGERIYARGAQDNKGQIFYFLQALACLRELRAPTPPLRLLIEGDEETGSAPLAASLDAWRRRLGADILMVCDTLRDGSGRPALIAGLRGIAHIEVELRGAKHDLHSGVHGGVAPNPALGMARLLAGLHDARGRIRVAGFLDHLRPPSQRERAHLEARPPWNETAYIAQTGVRPKGGERTRPPLERAGFQPTIEVNGLHGGYSGPGIKTVIPSACTAKISCRLCPDQDPARCLDALKRHLHRRRPPGLRLRMFNECIGGAGFRLPLDSPVFRAAEEVLTALDSRGPVYTWEGASIPIVSALRDVSGAAPLLVGFGDETDRIHAPNESFSLDQFQHGLVYSALMLQSLATGA